MAYEPRLIIQVPRGSTVERQLEEDPPASVAGGDAVVEVGATDAQGNLEPPPGGQVVFAVPAPESFSREPEELHRVIAEAGTGDEPLVIVIEAVEELADSDLRLVLGAAARARRPVILRVIRQA